MPVLEESMRGQVCLVTGATSGIGAVAARELARRGAHVVLTGRDPARCAAAAAEIKYRTGAEVETLVADLSVQQQVRDLARQFRERHTRLHVLVNNAGAIFRKREATADGLERTFALNHLAYFLLTQSLRDLLEASAPARVVNVSSRAHQGAVLDFDDLQGRRSYNGWRAYCRSKLANLLFTFELSRRLAGTGVTANALHPGWVATGFGGNNGWLGHIWQFAARQLAIGPEEGAQTIIYLACSPEVAGVSGKYFAQEKVVEPSAAASDLEAARRLWEVSLALTGTKTAVP
jgi:NAD(P)-dependent dehydrogenase (short-subunit alcohol dehydrogenase family)